MFMIKVFKPSVADKLDCLALDTSIAEVELFVPRMGLESTDLSRSNAEKSYVIVNGRPVELKPIHK